MLELDDYINIQRNHTVTDLYLNSACECRVTFRIFTDTCPDLTVDAGLVMQTTLQKIIPSCRGQVAKER